MLYDQAVLRTRKKARIRGDISSDDVGPDIAITLFKMLHNPASSIKISKTKGLNIPDEFETYE